MLEVQKLWYYLSLLFPCRNFVYFLSEFSFHIKQYITIKITCSDETVITLKLDPCFVIYILFILQFLQRYRISFNLKSVQPML